MAPTRVAFSQDCLEVKSPNQPVTFTFICQMQACGGTSFREGNQEEVDQSDWSSRLRSRLQVAQMFFFPFSLDACGCGRSHHIQRQQLHRKGRVCVLVLSSLMKHIRLKKNKCTQRSSR
ncbi:uncharacterized protein LOC144007636 isoform X1 [Festucalex cinctus]